MTIEGWSRREFLVKSGSAALLASVTSISFPRSARAYTKLLLIEAESMMFPRGARTFVESDATASGGAVLRFEEKNTAMKTEQTLSGPAVRVRIKAKAKMNASAGWPRMAVLVDGVVVARWKVSSTGYVDYVQSLTTPIVGGTHEVKLQAVQGFAGPGTAWVDYVEFQADDPPPPSIWIGVYHGSWYDLNVTMGFAGEVAKLGIEPNVFMWYPNASPNWTGSQWPFETTKVNYIWINYGALPYLSWEWWINTAYAEINAGQHDAYIDAYAQACAANGRPILMRPFWEMNTNEMPWQISSSALATAHKNAWIRLVNRFRAAGANNVKWYWCPNEGGAYTNLLSTAWPGDEYVDYIGMDGYNWGTIHGGWRSAVQITQPMYDLLTGMSTRPFIIGEINSREVGAPGGESKATWVNDARNNLPTAFPRLAGVCIFDAIFGEYNDWPVDSSTAALDAFKAWFADPRYQGTLT